MNMNKGNLRVLFAIMSVPSGSGRHTEHISGLLREVSDVTAEGFLGDRGLP